jgi:hypothetical protein
MEDYMDYILTAKEFRNLNGTLDKTTYMLHQAVEDIRILGQMGQNICPVCAHYNHGAGSPEHCPKALKEDCFEWRGMKEG